MAPAPYVVLPPNASEAALQAVQRGGGVPVWDATTALIPDVPTGTWVRARHGGPIPGTGPVILVGEGAPVTDRPTWLETDTPGPIPEGFAGVVLKVEGAGGRASDLTARAMLARCPEPERAIVYGALAPVDVRGLACAGVLLVEAHLGCPELSLPDGLGRRLDLAPDDITCVVAGMRVSAAPTAPVVRRLATGEDPWALAEGLWTRGDPTRALWIAGDGLRLARPLAAAHGTLAELVGAYRDALVATEPGATGHTPPVVAIVGLGCRLPGANSVEAFWSNVTGGVSSIGDVPPERWDPALYYDPDPEAPDKTYTRIGGFLTGFTFDSKRFRIPPRVADQLDPVQQITLASVADALHDAGLKIDARSEQGRAFDRERCAVILGNSLGGEVKDRYALRLSWPEVEIKVRTTLLADQPAPAQKRLLAALEASYKQDLPVVNEDSMPGELSNVIAGRIANAFDLGGANFTVDAACASSMAAVQSAVKGLQDGDFDLAITGGADRSMNLPTYVKFCKIGALSPDHSSPFDASANGFVMGEGCGILVLKRLDEALRDGDRVYAVIKGIGASSDGKGKGITAPNINGQILALERAYADAGVDPAQVDLIEAHGTSTVVGDKVEIDALTQVIGPGRRRPDAPIRIGSVKSMIGHLKSAAGAASLMKAALALHHGVLPPSLGYRNARTDVSLDGVPLRVQTETEAWPPTADGVRRAGVSAFGFGGTNFHVVLESWSGQAIGAHRAAPTPARPTIPRTRPPPPSAPDLPEGVWATSGRDTSSLIANLRALRQGHAARWDASDPVRIAAASRDDKERQSQLDRAIAALEKDTNPDMLRARFIYLEDGPADGALAMLFTGQGSQYADMGLDLAAAYPVVQATFDEADAILTPRMGTPISALIRLADGEDRADKEELLRRTEISQPATLTLDVAVLRLLAAYGVAPDMVAGHSLGEYGAAVAAGILTFEQALLAVSARGREMANIQLDDPGKMAGIAASTAAVEEVLAEVDGYVIPANKNCPTQTVIAGASDAVDEATERFRARGMTVYPLPVSHAFHSRIVAPASEPLRKVLAELGLREPRRPITTNVDADWYPTGDGAVERIIDLLAQQISAPVEWTAQIERMYADGARLFVECGPKRALTGFTVAILKRRPHRALYTNHPKRGGVWSFRDALAGLLVAGVPVRATPEPGIPDLFFDPPARTATSDVMEARLAERRPAERQAPPAAVEAKPDITEGVLRIVADTTGYDVEELDLDFELEADLGIDTVKQAEVFSIVRDTYEIPSDPDFSFADHRTLRAVIDWAASRLGATRPARQPPPPPPLAAARPPPPGPAVPAVDQALVRQFAEAVAHVQGLDADVFAQAMLPVLQGAVRAAFDAAKVQPPPPPTAQVVERMARAPAPVRDVHIVCSGASLGLPGGDEVFAEDNIRRILEGENRISHIGDQAKGFLDLNLVRLVKDAQTGEGSFLPVEQLDQVIRLAGTKARFDVTDYGVPTNLARALDITTELAIAAGIEALKDAGIPLVRTWHQTQGGKRVPTGWALPEPLRDGTGVVFASAFPGYDSLVRHIESGGDDGEGQFDRRFLLQVLAMGHSQLAQFIGARGPNTQVNAACASTTQALAIAEDWIRAERCDRVLVVGADDVTSEALLKWFGGGFMAAGAATTEDDVSKAALPFDRRRHGMIMGMGAVGLVIERDQDVRDRGVLPIAELLGTRIANSAYHGTRLDPAHIAGHMDGLVREVAAREGISAADIASSALFMSHETYTPARGGSAAAEIDALRVAFGPQAAQISIANTKGFTGHSMGAGVEDAIAVKALQYGRVPPVANFEEPDEALGDLRISRGEKRNVVYAIRLAAGFGSQLAIAIWKRAAYGDTRVPDNARRAAWLRQITGFEHVDEVISDRTLRVQPAEVDALLPLPSSYPPDEVTTQETPVPAALRAAAPPVAPKPPAAVPDMRGALIALIAEKTGYDPEELDPEFELEADLGIDTVKQAEIFSDLRDRYGIARDDDFRFSDHPTIEALSAYLHEARAGSARSTLLPDVDDDDSDDDALPPDDIPTETAPLPEEMPTDVQWRAPVPPSPATPVPAVVRIDRGSALPDLLAVIAEKTGYETGDLDPEFELEADLGIDTVKQAEIFSDLRDRYGLARDDDFRLSEFPTIEALARYLDTQRGETAAGDAHARADEDEETTTLVPDRWAIDTNPSAPGWTPVPDERLHLPDDLDELDEDLEPTFVPAPARTETPRAQQRREFQSPPLPASFRVRRPVLVPRRTRFDQSIAGMRVQVLGSGAGSDAIRAALTGAGALLEAPYQAVVDAGVDVLDSLAVARELDRARPERWLTLTRLGGLGTEAPAARAFADGARAGFAKALGREWPETAARVIDLPPEEDDDTLARTVLDELQVDDVVEVFRRGTLRQTVAYRTVTVPEPAGLRPHAVVVITGGARGICARVAHEIARRGPVHIAVVGRSAEPGEVVDLTAAKKRIKAELKANHGRVTPRMVEEELTPLRKANEVRENLDGLKALGADVRYYDADLADVSGIEALVARVAADFGGIDVLVHGAGVEESRLIADKDDDAFRRVFDGKARGGRALLDALPAATFVVSMGSVAGRYGNAGQVDYAAANDALARLCLCRPNALHVDWTAWDDVGMAVRGGMRRLLENRGVELLPAEAGAGLVIDLIAARITGELVVAGALGDFEPPATHPLLDQITFDGDKVLGTRELSAASDPWITDHAIDGTAVLPGVIGLELMTAVACAASPGLPPVGAKQVRFDKPVKLHRDQPVLLILEADKVDDFEVRCSLSSERTLRTGRTQRTVHFRAVVILGEVMQPDNLPSAFFPDEPIDAAAIYERFFHGPRFQVLEGVEGVAVDGLLARAQADWDAIAPFLHSAPLALEAAFQAAGLHRMVTAGQMALPSSIDEVRLIHQPALGDTLELMVHHDGVSYDIDVDGDQGAVMRVRGFAMTDLDPLPPGKRFEEPEGGRPRCFPDRAPTPVNPYRSPRPSPGDATARATWSEDDAEDWLTADELAEIRARGTERRVRDRIAGRIAAKRALSRLTGHRPHTIRIRHAPSGEPLAEVPEFPDARVSISHRDGRAVAIAVDRGRVGIDLEKVEPRAESFAEDWITDDERDLVGDDPERQTVVWSIKEAVLKALGTGLAMSPRDVVVTALSAGVATVDVRGTAAAEHRRLGGGAWTVHWERDEGAFVIATARFAA